MMQFKRKSPAGMVEQALMSYGYEFDRTNKTGWSVFTRSGAPDVPVNPKIAERDARHLIVKIERGNGVKQVTNKRNAQAIKDHRAVERARIKAEMDRLDAERTELIRQKQMLPTGAFDHLARSRRLQLEREIQRIEQERNEWVRLMQSNESTEELGA